MRLRTSIPIMAAVGFFLPQIAAAQAATPPATAKPPAPPADEIRIRAEIQETVEKGHFRARGFVDLQAGEVRIQADELDFYESNNPDGTKNQRVIANGNVVFLRVDERLAGEHLDMDLGSGQGTIEHASGYVQPGVFVEGRTITRLDANTYRIEEAKFTSCAQPNPRWGFTAATATIHVDERITAKNVLFKVKDVPSFYLPYLFYPIHHDQRSTGFLIPHIGTSTTRGFLISEAFFWAMSRSVDQTFIVDHYAILGFGAGHEIRYALDSPSRGVFRTYVLFPAGGKRDFDLDWNALQMLPGKLRAALAVRQYSNLAFQQVIQDNFVQATTRTTRSSFSLQRSLLNQNLQLLLDSTGTYFGNQKQVNDHLPMLKINRSSTRIGKSDFVWTYEARAEELGRSTDTTSFRYSRFDLAPQISRPFGKTFIQVNPQVAVRYTHYGASLDKNNNPEGPSVDRRFFESNLDLRGPTFSRVFASPFKFYTDKIKHVLGPEVTYRYRSAVEDFNNIPKFDGNDQFLGTDQIDYALVQRLVAKRPSPAGGKPAPFEFFNWRLQQSYYVQIGNNQNNFDPNYSSSAFGPGGTPAHLSPLQSRMRFQPSNVWSTNFDVEYDVNFKQLHSLGLSTRVSHPRASLQAGWSKVEQLAVHVQNRATVNNFIRGLGSLQILPKRLTVDGGVDYDFVNKKYVDWRVRGRYEAQCCGFTVEMINFNYNGRQETQFHFSVELANIGSLGNSFLGQDPNQARQGLGGFR